MNDTVAPLANGDFEVLPQADAAPARPPAMIVQRETPPTEAMVEIPANALIQCPKVGRLIRGTRCETCEFFEALNIRMQGPKIAFEAKYTCVCKYPTQRVFYNAELG
jgi:hypothetical protein